MQVRPLLEPLFPGGAGGCVCTPEKKPWALGLGTKAGLTKCPQYLIKSLISRSYSPECMVPSNPGVPPKRHCLPVKAGSEPRLTGPAHSPSTVEALTIFVPLSPAGATTPHPVTWPSRASWHLTPLHPLSNVSLTSFVKRCRRPLLRASQDSSPPPGFRAEALGQQPNPPPQGSGTWAGTRSAAWTKR